MKFHKTWCNFDSVKILFQFKKRLQNLHGLCGSYLTPHWTDSKLTQALLIIENREGY